MDGDQLNCTKIISPIIFQKATLGQCPQLKREASHIGCSHLVHIFTTMFKMTCMAYPNTGQTILLCSYKHTDLFRWKRPLIEMNSQSTV